MKVPYFEPVIAAFLAAGSLSAVSAHAEGLDIGGSLGALLYQDSVNGISGNGSDPSGNLFGGVQIPPNFLLPAGVADPCCNDDAAAKMDGRSDVDAGSAAPPDDEWALLDPFALAHVDLDISGADSNGTKANTALGPQYSLSSNVTLGGTWERYSPDAFGAHSDVDQYTFGMRVVF